MDWARILRGLRAADCHRARLGVEAFLSIYVEMGIPKGWTPFFPPDVKGSRQHSQFRILVHFAFVFPDSTSENQLANTKLVLE